MLKKNSLQALKERIYRLRYYDSIECLPVENWFKIHQSGDLKLLVRNDIAFKMIFIAAMIPMAYYLGIVSVIIWASLGLLWKDKPEAIWTKIYDEFIARIGLSQEYMEYVERTKRIATMQCDYVLNPSPADKIAITRELRELKEVQNEKQTEYSHVIAQVSKAQGYRIDPKVVTVLEFYSYLKAQ